MKSGGEYKWWCIVLHAEDANINHGVDPQMNKVERHVLRIQGKKHSISSRHKGGINARPPHNVVQPTDTKGTLTTFTIVRFLCGSVVRLKQFRTILFKTLSQKELYSLTNTNIM